MPIQTRRKQKAEVAVDSDMLNMDENDTKIVNATLKAFETGTLTPLIKEELRCTIQSRRLAQGKGELQVEFRTPQKKVDMTEDERRRAVKRRQQNREAAQRFRQKQKDTSDYLSNKIRKLEKISNGLEKQMEELRKERDELKDMLRSHMMICSNPEPNNFPEIDINQLLSITDTEPTLSSTSSAPRTGSFCPDTSSSVSSVFFPDNEELPQAMEQSEFYVQEGMQEELVFSKGDDLNGFEIVPEDPNQMYVGEVVVEIRAGNECGEDYIRPDSTSSVDTSATYDSWRSDLPLSESTTDLRHSLTSAFAKVQAAHPQIEVVEDYTSSDFLLMTADDAT